MARGRQFSRLTPLAGMVTGGLVFATMIGASTVFERGAEPHAVHSITQTVEHGVTQARTGPDKILFDLAGPAAPADPRVIAGNYDGDQSDLFKQVALQIGVVPTRDNEVRIALVIGNADYRQTNWGLPNPVNDARLIAERLIALNFKVDLVEDATKANMSEALRRYKKDMDAAGDRAVSVVYYAGHGIQENDVNYLVPVDAEIEDEFDIEDWSLRLDRVLRLMRETGNFVNIVFLDACRNNPMSEPTRGLVRGGLAETPMEENFLISYAAMPGQKALDGDGDNSPYTSALAEALETHASRPLYEVMIHVRTAVRAATERRQTPEIKDGLLDAPLWALVDESQNQRPDFERVKTAEEKALDTIATFLDKQDFSLRDNQTWDVLDVIVVRYEGIELLEKLAAAGHVAAMTVLSTAYREGRYVEIDLPYAARLNRDACAAGGLTACLNLGWMFSAGLGAAQDDEKATALYRQACDGGYANGCSSLGYMYDAGRGVEQDYERAVALYRQACDGGSAYGCNNLGYMYDAGRGVEQDYERAVALYRQACDGGSALGCNNLGNMYDAGRGVEQDYERAVALYRQACDGGSALGCKNLGVMYKYGLGVAQGGATARHYYRKACDLGEETACEYLED